MVLLAALGFGARMRGVASPPFDFHPTRQYYALLFAQDYRNSLCGDPRSAEALAARESRAGEALLEPPVIPAATAIGWCAVGRESTALPRVLMALGWCVGALALGMLARALGGVGLGPLVAAAWTLFHPYAVAAGRSVQPDGPMVTLLLFGAWFLARDRSASRPSWWRGAVGALSTAVFVKLVAVFFAAPMLVWSLRERSKPLRDKALIAMGIAPSALWYAHGWFVEGSLRHQGSGRFQPALLLRRVFWDDLALRVESVTGLWPVAAAFALTLFVLRGPARAFALLWFAAQVAYGVAFTHHVYTHDYYCLALIPWVGLCLGLGGEAILERLPRGRRAAGALLALAAAACAVGGVREAWRSADRALRDAGEEAQEGARLGRVLGHSVDVLMQARWYGLPMKFHGRFAAEYWPDHIELAEDPRRWSPEERIRRAYRGRIFRWFVLADPREIPLQPGLWRVLQSRCALSLRTPRTVVFRCGAPENSGREGPRRAPRDQVDSRNDVGLVPPQ